MSGRTIILSGGSRGIGLAIALAAAARGANVALLAKTDKPNPRLEGTIHTAAAAIVAAGGQALPLVGDVRDEDSVAWAVAAAVAEFGGIDICINNASAISLASTESLSPRRFDLMQEVNVRGSWLLTRAALPYLRRAPNPHILTISPPINLAPVWLGAHPAYTVSKYGMTLLTLGWAAELAQVGIAANCLWPKTMIATAAVANVIGDDAAMRRARDPRIMADAAMSILAGPSRETTGECFVDEQVLRDVGVQDMAQYGGGPNPDLDFFLD